VCGHRNQRVKDMEWIREADHVHATLKVRMVSWVTYEAARCVFGTEACNIPSTGSPAENRGHSADWRVISGKIIWNMTIKCGVCKENVVPISLKWNCHQGWGRKWCQWHEGNLSSPVLGRNGDGEVCDTGP
jgi:hypothetical protein